jgi:hypothetical protein
MPPLAALTPADLLVALGLVLLAALMWGLRRYVGFLLRLLPFFAAVAGPILTWGLYRLGEHMNWDSPGSPAILVVMAALGGAALMSVTAWIALAIQVARWRRPRVQSPQAAASANSVRVAGAILVTMWALTVAYRDYRSHRPSHEAAVQQMYFTPDGASLYSLDRAGVLKQWNIRDAFQAQAWSLADAGEASAISVSGDGRALLVLAGDELSAWSLDEGSEARRIGGVTGVLGAETLDGVDVVVLTRDALSIRAYSDLLTAKVAAALSSAALSLSAYAGQGIVVGTAEPALAHYRATANPPGLVRGGETALDFAPRRIRVDRSGRYVVALDPGVRLAALDAQGITQDPINGYYEPLLFEISEQAQLLLAQVNDVRGYDLAQKTSLPLYNHGGTITALAASPASDLFAVANEENIWLHGNSRAYAGEERWLNGRVELPAWLRIR